MATISAPPGPLLRFTGRVRNDAFSFPDEGLSEIATACVSTDRMRVATAHNDDVVRLWNIPLRTSETG